MDIDKLRLTGTERLKAIVNGDDEWAEALAQAQLAKALWGLVDAQYQSAEQVNKYIPFLANLEESLIAAGIPRPEEK